MKKLLTLVAISLMVLGFPNAHARNSAATYDNKYYSQQEFVAAYNASTAPMYRDYAVGLFAVSVGDGQAIPTINPNNNLGQYITEGTTSTTDNIYAFGIVDDTIIPAGQLGRIAIRGPHKVQWKTGNGASAPTVGQVISQCSNNVPQFFNSTANAVQNGGVVCPYTTATGTAASTLGYILNATATTDTGDAGTTGANQSNTTGSEYWAWINPEVLR